MSASDKDFYERTLLGKQRQVSAAHSRELSRMEKILDKVIVDFLTAHIEVHDECRTLDTMKFEALAARYRELGDSLLEVSEEHKKLVELWLEDHSELLKVSVTVGDLTETVRALALAIVDLSGMVRTICDLPNEESISVVH